MVSDILQHISSLQAQWPVFIIILILGLLGGILVWSFKSLHWLILMIVVWSAVWVLAMPAGLDGAKLIAKQEGLEQKAACSKELAKEIEYWNKQKPLQIAQECKS